MPFFVPILGAAAAPKAVASLIFVVLGYVMLIAYQRPEMLLTFHPIGEDRLQIKMISVDSSNVHQTSMIIKTSSVLGSGQPIINDEAEATFDKCICPYAMLPVYDDLTYSSFSCKSSTGVEMCPPVLEENHTSGYEQARSFQSAKTWRRAAGTRNSNMSVLPMGAVTIKKDADGSLQCHNVLGKDSPYCQLVNTLDGELRREQTMLIAGSQLNSVVANDSTPGVKSIFADTEVAAVADGKPTDSNLLNAMHILAAHHFRKLIFEFTPDKMIETNEAEKIVSVHIESESIPIVDKHEVATFEVSNGSFLADVHPVDDNQDQSRAEELKLIEQAFVKYSIFQQKLRPATKTENIKVWLHELHQKLLRNIIRALKYIFTAMANVDIRLFLEHALLFVLDVSDFISNWINFQTLLIATSYAESFWSFADAVVVKPAIKILRRAINAYSVEQFNADVRYLREDFVAFMIILRNLTTIFVTMARRFVALCLMDQLFCFIVTLLVVHLGLMPFFVLSLPIAELFVRSHRKQLAVLEARLNAVADLYGAVEEGDVSGVFRLKQSGTTELKSFRVVYKALQPNSKLLRLTASSDAVAPVSVVQKKICSSKSATAVGFNQGDESMLTTPPSTPQHADSDVASDISENLAENNRNLNDEPKSLEGARGLPDVVASDANNFDESFHSLNDADDDHEKERESNSSTAEVNNSFEEGNSMSIANSSLDDEHQNQWPHPHATPHVFEGENAVAFGSSFVDT